MNKYKVYKEKKDFARLNNNVFNTKGTRDKFVVLDKSKNIAFFKYYKYNCRELCSEKMCSEIAKIIGFECAKIELAQDENGKFGVLNYRFVVTAKGQEHSDILEYLTNSEENRKEFYSLNNIIKCLNNLGSDLIPKFIQIMVFDALVGETDRHEENWGITKNKGRSKISPLYDNGCNLLWQCDDLDLLDFEKSRDNFIKFIKKSPTCIFNKQKHKYKHFELVTVLYEQYPIDVKKCILSLKQLSNKKIQEIVYKIPDNLLTDLHKKYIIQYLIIRRDILLDIISEGNE